MSLFAVTLAGEIRAARAALHRAGIETHPLWLAVNHAAACAADLERAERLLDSERSSAEAARAALDRALQLFEIEAEQQRRRDEADHAAPALDRKAEEQRLRKTLALADEAIREAATLRSADLAKGETAGETALRWNEAGNIEAAAVACRKAARKALGALTVFADKRSPEQQAEAIEAARPAALALKAAIDGRSKKGGAL